MSSIAKFFHPGFTRMRPYSPIEPPDQLAKRLGLPPEQILKLDANENPFGLHPDLRRALAEEKYLHVYPDPAQVKLRAAIAAYAKLAPNQVVAGAGADELLDLVMRLFLQPGDQVLGFSPSFSYYDHVVSLNHGKYQTYPRKADFSLSLKEVKEIDFSAYKMVILCSPNNPSGNPVEKKVLEYLLQQDLLVLLDEAYGEFAKEKGTDYLAEHENLIILRTFSKCFALAGMRVGYGLMAPIIAQELMKIKPPYSVNVAAEALALKALAHWPIYAEQIQQIKASRDWFWHEVRKVPGLTPFPTEANFILCRVTGYEAKKLKEELEQEGILVRYFAQAPLRDCIRVTAGTQAQMARLLRALQEKMA